MQSMGSYLFGAAFWLFIGAVAIAGMIADYKRRRLGIEVLRAAIDRGQPLDPAMVEKLMAHEHRDERINPLDLKLGGIITIASGLGLGPLAYFVGRVVPVAFDPILGIGVLAVFVGIGLLIGARALMQARARESSDATHT